MIDLNIKFEEAKKGKKIWEEIKGKYGNSESMAVIIIPKGNKKLITGVLENIEVYGQYRKVSEYIVVSNDLFVEEEVKRIDNDALKIEKIEGEDRMQQFLSYYRLLTFTKNVVIVSDEEPYGCNYLDSYSGVDLLDYITSAVYKIR